MQKSCSRCTQPITCQVNDIENCACNTVVLSPQTQSYLAQTQYDCLCNNCLQELDELVYKAQNSPIPKTGADFQENVHYYMDQGVWVMTEFYLLQRGYCCKNGCRHCAYGYQRT